MRTLHRYLLLQVPGWILAGLLAAIAIERLWLPPALAVGLVALLLLKDLVVYRWVRPAYELDPRSELEKLIGARAVVRQPLDPAGFVWLQGALWRAEVAPAQAPVAAGRTVRIHGVRRLTLLVTPDE
jgi:membrane protein implicated in regulation of membrane protease activity